MFILTTVSDLVQIQPHDLGKPTSHALEDNISAKYCNRVPPSSIISITDTTRRADVSQVIQQVGLCICLFDVLYASDGRVGTGTGIVNINVEFRLIVFRPFEGEIIVGRIGSASEKGIKVRLDFFDDIIVPPHLMFPGSEFDVSEQVWTWTNEGQKYFYDKHEWIRVRIEAERWTSPSPLAPAERFARTETERKSPYSITASMMQSGLGPVEWW